jgi:predicted anti-sigma-YlaC factor YlaD
MNCGDYQHMISRLVDLDLKATASSELFVHLGKCAQCREFLDTTMKLNAELDKIGVMPELLEGANYQQPFVVASMSVPRFGQHRSLGSRISTFALLLMVTLFIGLLFSVNIDKPSQTEPIPQELAQPR